MSVPLRVYYAVAPEPDSYCLAGHPAINPLSRWLSPQRNAKSFKACAISQWFNDKSTKFRRSPDIPIAAGMLGGVATDMERALGALRDFTRRDIMLRFYADRKTRSVEQVAREASVHRSVAFEHLERLV